MPIENKDLAAIRRDYSRQELSEDSVAADPFVQFANWFDEYLSSGPIEPSAMTVSTVAPDGGPASRVVLLKGFDASGFVFFTNYESTKGRHIAENPRIALHFFWPELERQVAVRGVAEKVSREESESYFRSRPPGSRIGAWASRQSTVLSSRRELEDSIAEVRERFGEGDVPCPPFWGGFRVAPASFEFWQGRPSRLHDRILYTKDGEMWETARLSP